MHEAEVRLTALKSEVDSLRSQLTERDSHITTIEDLQLQLKKQLSSHVAEISVSCFWLCIVDGMVPVFYCAQSNMH